MYSITIRWQHGAVTRAVVNAQTMRGFKLSACKGASVKIIKVKS